MNLKDLLSSELKLLSLKLNNDDCELSSELIEEILTAISHEPLSKKQAYTLLGITRNQFDYLVRSEKIPPGRLRDGFKEQVWYKDELLKYMSNDNL